MELADRNPGPDEARIIQYLRPDGRRREMFAPVGEDHAARSRDLILSAEVLVDGTIAIYGRRKGEPEHRERIEFAVNGPGPDSPANVLRRMIDRLNPKAEEKG